MGRALLLTVLATLCLAASASARDFENPQRQPNDTSQQFTAPVPPPAPPANVQRQDTPNDPDYDQAEPDNEDPGASNNFYDERFDLFGFPSALTPAAVYKDGPNAGKRMVSGFNAAGAWKAERGRTDVTVAILDTGIRWSETSLRDQIHLNTGELPLPEHADGSTCGAYDCNGDHAVNVDDYKDDPRVDPRVVPTYAGREGPADLITGQDLLHGFGTCKLTADHAIDPVVGCPADGRFDNDANGYANDLVGWNFFDNTNDPTDRSSYFAASNHGTDRAQDAAERGNDGQGSIGVCPHCQVMPIRVWDTFVSDGNTFGLAMAYATDNGVDVIEGADGSLYHSAFADHASQYAYDHGVVQTYSGDDLNTANHNYPGNYGHAMLIQGTVPDTVGLGKDLPSAPAGSPAFLADLYQRLRAALTAAGAGTNLPVGTYFRGANTTQYGGKSSISMEGPTGSVNTGKASGGVALVIASARDHGIALRPDETREILEQTAERVTDGNTEGVGTPDPGASPASPPDAQFTTHFGWGRADLGAAVSAAADTAKIPPEAAIDSPDWYAPVTGDSVDVTGRARARFADGGAFHWKLLVGPGLAPSSLQTVREGDGTGTVTDFGPVDLAAIRASLATTDDVAPLDRGGPVFAPHTNPFKGQFTVQLEVTAKVGGVTIPITGIDRRVLTALADPTLRAGFPKRMGTGGEAPIRYGDLDGDNTPELIVPTEDGLVHAYEPDGSELAGWPVRTELQSAAAGHLASPALSALDPPREPPRGPVLADLDGSGRRDVVTAAGTHVYAWHPDGTPVAGFPVSSDLSNCRPALERQAHGTDPGSHPKCGFLATPAVARLEGRDGPLDIVAPSLDGHLYAFRPDGATVPGYPVALVDPDQSAAGTPMVAESINEPAVGNLAGHADGADDVVVATNEVYGSSGGGGDVSFGAGVGTTSTRVYAVDGPTGHLLTGWPIAIPGIIQDVLPFIGPGQDPALVKVGATQEVIVSATGGSLTAYGVDGQPVRTMQQHADSGNATDKSGALNLFESASVGDLTGAGRPDVVKYHVTLNQAANLLLVGQNQPYNHLIGAYDADTGAPVPSFPTVTDDYQFLSSSNVAKVSPSGPTNQVVAGTGLGLLHAYDGATGLDVSGFPKVTGGWLFAPAALAPDGRLADITREGFLFEWGTQAPPCQTEWPAFRHDPQSSGNYDRDGTPPDAASHLALTPLGGDRFRLSFTSPGDDGACGTAAAYVARADGRPLGPALGAPVAGGSPFSRDVALPAGARTLTVQAADEAGNLGFPVTVALPRPGAAGDHGPSTRSQPSTRAACRDRTPPRSRHHGRVRATRDGLRLGGRATDATHCAGKRGRVRRVRISVMRKVGKRCRPLLASGRFGAVRSCRATAYLSARGGARWTFARKVRLAPGRYEVWSRAIDASGNLERKARGRNLVRVRVR